MARVRVRGIAATALTKLLLDKGHVIVQASRIIQERFGIQLNTAPADVTVKDGDQDELVVIGFPREALEVFNDIVSELEYVFTWRPKLNLHSIVVARVKDVRDNTCILELPHGLYGELSNCSRREGDLVVVSIARAPIKPWEKPRVTTSLRVIGEYVALIHGSTRLSISEHVRDQEKRKELLATATAAVLGKGYGVHLRSSSLYASPEDIVREINELEKKIKEIIEKARSLEEPSIVYEGEFIGIIGLTSTAKERLDEIRSSIVPTIKMHHSLKTYGGTLSDIVDYIEIGLSKGLDREKAFTALNEFIVSKIKSIPRVRIVHVKPDGRVLELTPGKVEVVLEKENSFVLRVKRVFRSRGVLDGLGVEKQPGDYDEMIVDTSSWHTIHNYYRADGTHLGTYVNINTPPEISTNTIKYHDLSIDVVKKPGEEPEIIDIEELEKYYQENIITEKLYKKALEEAEKIYNELKKR